MLTDKEKLEEELSLLEESLHLEVITKEEYEQAKHRIEKKLKTLEKKEEKAGKKTEEAKINEIKQSEIKEPRVEQEENALTKSGTPSVENPEEEEKEEAEEIIKSAEEIAAEQVKRSAKETETREEKEEVAEKIEDFVPITRVEEKLGGKKEDTETAFEISKGSMKVLIYAIAILVLAFGSYFFFFSGNANDNKLFNSNVFIACNSDQDCRKEGSIGTCNNPGTKDAECAFVEDVEAKLFVLNSVNCFNCDTGRVLSILNGFFPNLNIENLDIESDQGKEVADKFDINALPAYILNSSLQQASNYHKFFNAFNNVEGSFVMKNTVANSNFYVGREETPEKLDLIIQQNQAASLEAEKNLQEFLSAFDGKVSFRKHGENSALSKELGINTFPVFLVNNKIKFSGVQAADVIKENFCRMNKLDKCSLELSKSLV